MWNSPLAGCAMNTEVCLIRADTQPAGDPGKRPRQGCPPRSPSPGLQDAHPCCCGDAVGTSACRGHPAPALGAARAVLPGRSVAGDIHANTLLGHQPRAAEMFPYRQHQVFAVITTAIIISFGVFSCHNLSLALIYSAGLFPSTAGGKQPSIRRQRAPSPAEASPSPERSRGAHGWGTLSVRAGPSPQQRVARTKLKPATSRHGLGAGSSTSDTSLLFQHTWG